MYRPAVGARRLDRLAPDVHRVGHELIDPRPLGTTIGAEIAGVDLSQPLSDALFDEVDAAFREWKVIVFREQSLTPDQFVAFAQRWGRVVEDSLPRQAAHDGAITPYDKPVDNVAVFTRDEKAMGLENIWHVDGSYRRAPVLGTMLAAIDVPGVGGDTMFVDMAAAYDNLPPADRDRIEGRWAEHDWSIGGYAAKYQDRLDEYRHIVPPVEHPVVIDHPRTGRRTLFVNRGFTTRILGLEGDEGDALLDRLTRQADIPEYQLRVRWEPGMVVFWDNFAVQHYAVNDFWPQRRTMMRATVEGVWETGRAGGA